MSSKRAAYIASSSFDMFSVTCSITVTLLRIAFSIDFLVFSKAPSCPHCVSWILVLQKNYQLPESERRPSEIRCHESAQENRFHQLVEVKQSN